MGIVNGILSGMASSLIFYEIAHARGFPELARYIMGNLIIYWIYCAEADDEESCTQLFVAMCSVGIGVGAARIIRTLKNKLLS